jgi:hypothetical protein
MGRNIYLPPPLFHTISPWVITKKVVQHVLLDTILLLMTVKEKNRTHESTISLRFLEIILRFLRLEVCIGFLNHREGGMVFYQVFLLSPL